MRRLTTVLILCLAMIMPARATTHYIAADAGGLLVVYIAKYQRWARNGDYVVIEGACQSACTLMLGIIDNRRMCATRFAEFAFHSASDEGRYTLNGTLLMWSHYQGRTAKVLARHGWPRASEHPALISISAQEILQPCKGMY